MYFDRMDIVEAHYCFCAQWHNGQTCPLYARLSKILGKMRFKPGLTLQKYFQRALSENGKEIYYSLVQKLSP